MGKEFLEPDEIPRKFEGVWIRREIWLNTKLTPLQKCLAGEIDSIGVKNGPCFASDEYLARLFSCSVGTIKNMLTILCKLGVIKRLGFDSQGRRLLSVNRFTESVNQITESVDEITESVKDTVTESVTQNHSPNKGIEKSRLERKEERKESASPELHEAIALWIQAYNEANTIPYDVGTTQKQKQDASSISRLLNMGMTPVLIEATFKAAIKAGKDRPEDRNLFWCRKMRSMTEFAANINKIDGELKTPVQSTANPKAIIAERINKENRLKALKQRHAELDEATHYEWDKRDHPELVVEKKVVKAEIDVLEKELTKLTSND